MGCVASLTDSFFGRVALGAARTAFNTVGALKLLAWLEEQEELHQVVLYLADTVNSPWMQRCVRQADLILVVAAAEDARRKGEEAAAGKMKAVTAGLPLPPGMKLPF